MKLIGKVPVEPLDDERLTNIERNLVVAVSDMRAPEPLVSRRALAFAGVAMAIALAGFAGWKLHKTPVVESKRQTFAMKSDAKGSTLDLGDAQLASMPGTDVRVERTATRTSIDMARGTLDLTVEHKPGRLLVVRAGDTEIEDIGTKFSVVFDGKSHVEVRVTEGEVKVHRAAQDIAVTASNAWTTELGPTTIAQLDAAHGDVAAQLAQNDVAPNDAAQNDAAQNNAVQNGASQTKVAATTNQLDTPLAVDSRGSAADNRGSGSGSGAVKKPRKSGVKEAILAVELHPLPGTTAELTEQLKTAGSDTSTIMYSIAVSQHLAKDDRAALHLIEGPLTRNRKSDAAYKDIMWLNVRIKCLKAFDGECRIAAQRYLNNIESGPAAGVAQAILEQPTL